MADEIKVALYLRAVKDNRIVDKRYGISAVTRGDVVNGIQSDWTGTKTGGQIQTIGTEPEALTVNPDITSPGWFFRKNVGDAEVILVGTRPTLKILSTPGTPTISPQGVTGATSYSYKVVACDAYGKTLASTAGTTATGNATLTGSNFNRVSWSAVTGAETYRVYGRTGGAELYIATVTAPTVQYDDTLAVVTPAGAVPAANTTGFEPFDELETGDAGLSKVQNEALYAVAPDGEEDLEFELMER
jgi:hypothetical protein